MRSMIFQPKSHYKFYDNLRAECQQPFGGTIIFHAQENEKYIYIDKMIAPSHAAEGNGFGTAAMRYIINKSFEKGYDGNIELAACWSSHIFYLLMGMIPKEKEISYIQTKYGIPAQEDLNKLKLCLSEDDLLLYDKTDYLLYSLKRILHSEMNIPVEAQMTAADIFGHKDYLLSLENKKGTFICDSFIPDLLNTLKNDVEKKFPNTEVFGSVPMILSSGGKERWCQAINEKKAFEPFKRFEPIRPFMTEGQIQILDDILDARANIQLKISEDMKISDLFLCP